MSHRLSAGLGKTLTHLSVQQNNADARPTCPVDVQKHWSPSDQDLCPFCIPLQPHLPQPGKRETDGSTVEGSRAHVNGPGLLWLGFVACGLLGR